MKRLILILALFFVIFILLCNLSCKQNKDGELTKLSFSDYSLSGTSCLWNTIDMNKVIIINSNKELEKYINCNGENHPIVDFSQFTLLLVSGGTTSGISKITKNVFKESNNIYILEVTVLLNLTTVAQGWSVAILIPKIHDNSVVTLNLMQTY
ncbi:hypothetical protein FACS189430_09710 [Bacteroidia bacterium]|nr:hypothetical protein FACS189430_09710 [Bacteroidia bacterium]